MMGLTLNYEKKNADTTDNGVRLNINDNCIKDGNYFKKSSVKLLHCILYILNNVQKHAFSCDTKHQHNFKIIFGGFALIYYLKTTLNR